LNKTKDWPECALSKELRINSAKGMLGTLIAGLFQGLGITDNFHRTYINNEGMLVLRKILLRFGDSFIFQKP
jgi:predicted lipid-binding transport protein (Tim44 family)